MVETKVPARSEIPEKYQWNAPSVFPTPQDWEAEAARLQEDISQLEAFRGKLSESPARLREALNVQEALFRRIGKVFVYATLTRYVDTASPDGTRMYGQAARRYSSIDHSVSAVAM